MMKLSEVAVDAARALPWISFLWERNSNGSLEAGRSERETAAKVIGELEELNRSTERDFLRIGESLMSIYGQIQTLAEDTSALAQSLCGQESARAAESLSAILTSATAAQESIAKDDLQLTDLQKTSLSVQNAFSEFRKSVPKFRALGALTRIEAARLGQAGAEFGTLVEELKSLHDGIQDRVDGVHDASAALGRQIQSSLDDASRADREQARTLPTLISEILQSLEAFQNRSRSSHELTGRLAQEVSSIAEAVAQLVSSIQFHDITRQQIEHVIDALRPWAQEAPAVDAQPGESRGAILSLQCGQLERAEALFARSIETIDGSLEQLSSRMTAMASQTKDLFAPTDLESSSFVKMERLLSRVLKMSTSASVHVQASSSAADKLQVAVAQIRSAVEEISLIEIQMERMALNAGISALRIGDAGSALEVLSLAMHSLSRELQESQQIAVAGLKRMSAGIESFEAGKQHQDVGEESAVQEVRGCIEQLHAAAEKCFGRMARVEELRERLAEQILGLRNSITVGLLVRETLTRCREELALCLPVATSGPPGLSQVEASLAHLSERYTMQQEREIHAIALGQVAGGQQPLAALSAAGSDEDSNVELF